MVLSALLLHLRFGILRAAQSDQGVRGKIRPQRQKHLISTGFRDRRLSLLCGFHLFHLI